MDVNILAWNLEDGFSNPEINQAALHKQILDAEPDIAVFPEAWADDMTRLPDDTRTVFEREHYSVYETAYKDWDQRPDKHGLVVLAKPELVHSSRIVRLVGRNAILLRLKKDVSFLGVHLVDRTNFGQTIIGGEKQRVKQARAANYSLDDYRAIVAGDFNATHRTGFMPAAFRVAGPLVAPFPAWKPKPHEKPPRFPYLISLAQRLSNMATGTTLQAFEEAHFSDADPQHKPTMQKKFIGAQLETIYWYVI